MKTSLSLLSALALVSAAPAADLQGAAKALERIAAAPVPAAPLPSPAKLFRERTRAFRDEAVKLAPDEAATRWLTLVDAYLALPNSIRNERDENGFDDAARGFGLVLESLPPPACWDALAEAVAKREVKPDNALADYGLRLLVATLRGDVAAGDRAVAALAALKADGNDWIANIKNQLPRLRVMRRGGEEDPKEIVAQVEKSLAAFEKHATPDDQSYDSSGVFPGRVFAIPDLVTLAGPAKAKELIKRALLLDAGMSFERRFVGHGVDTGISNETRQLAAKLALENVAKLKKAPWRLVQGLDDGALFEALNKRFPAAGKIDNDRQAAEVVYLLGLIATNRTPDAARFAILIAGHEDSRGHASLSGSAFEALMRAGHAPALFAFFHTLLGEHAELPYWNTFIEVGAQIGKSAETVATVRAALERNGLDGPTRHQLRAHLCAALLANDEVEEGVKLIHELLAEKPVDVQAPGKLDPQAAAAVEKVLGPLNTLPLDGQGRFNSGSENDPLEARRQFAFRLARLGHLLTHPEWIDEGLRAAREALPPASPENQSTRSRAMDDLVTVCVELSHLPEAEEILIQSIVEIPASQPGRGRDDFAWREQLTNLARLYEHAGRPQDVMTLLDQSPKWGARDVSELIQDEGGFSRAFMPIGYIAASALAATGHAAEARRMVETMLPYHVGADPLYELWFKLGGDDLPKRLDALFALDQFEERPLIWKAQWLLDAGQLEAAEKTARAAIAIDPSDGEQGKGDRMRAYAVLAAVLEKRGDAAQAKTLRGAVEAIRISENADDYVRAGLLTRAVKMYEEALTHFADAYCIQSRLAIQFAELGQMDKAEEHYRRAYELMPESFGRVESHCFGCEGAFSGERAQGIAEKVFTKLAVEMPQKAQIFYLLGYLREEEGRPAEALVQYRKAVQLDADYLNAWKKISELGNGLRLPHSDREDVALNLFRLDPFGRHGGGPSGLEAVLDFRAIWNSAAAAIHPMPPALIELYPLAASKAELVKLAATPGAGDQMNWGMRSFRSRDRFTSPASVLNEHPLIQTITQIIEAGAREE